MSSLEDRIARLEAESQIRQLIARYCFTIDDRDVDNIRALFAPDAVLKSADGVMNATGVDAIIVSNHGGRQLDGAPGAGNPPALQRPDLD
jgi:isopentenyl diphosphate isomerase/L-lactate dehydrogenase-like FMN-dependent dehydrogenase